MVESTDDLRPRGHVSLICDVLGCRWAEWRKPDSPDVAEKLRGAFRCDFCSGRQPHPTNCRCEKHGGTGVAVRADHSQ